MPANALCRRHLIGGLGAVWLASVTQAAAASPPVVIFAAASLKTALDFVMAEWQRQTGHAAIASYAASSALARQLTHQAPAHLFISADLEWMDYAAANGAIDAASRVNLLGNALVVVAPKGQAKPIALAPSAALAAELGSGRLAIADVASVPAGKYGKAALERLGIWDTVKDRLAPAENVRAALILVARGEAPLGIVYRSDAMSEPRVEVVATFPSDSHPPIIFPAALTRTPHPHAGACLSYLKSPAAAAIFRAHGFDVLT